MIWGERWRTNAGDDFLLGGKRKPGPELPRVVFSQANPVIAMGGERLLETWTALENLPGLYVVCGPCLHSVGEAKHKYGLWVARSACQKEHDLDCYHKNLIFNVSYQFKTKTKFCL